MGTTSCWNGLSMNGSRSSRRVAQAFKHEEGAGCPSTSITDANNVEFMT